jgi:hypothetical protein
MVEESNQMKQIVEGQIAKQYEGSLKLKFAKLRTYKTSDWIMLYCADGFRMRGICGPGGGYPLKRTNHYWLLPKQF